MDTLTELTEKFRSVWPLLDERTRRIMAASEARALGHGGVSMVRRACGLSRKAISKGLKVTCRLDRRKYPTGRKVSNEEMKRIKMRPNPFHGEWNYVIEPNSTE